MSGNEKDFEKHTQKNSMTEKPKREYVAPKIESEKISFALLAGSCNGMSSGGGRKATAPCTVLLS